MSSKMLDSTESIVNYIIEKFQKSEEIDIINITSKLDALNNMNLTSNDVSHLKKLIEFFFKNRNDIYNKNSTPLSEEYSNSLNNQIKNLKEKVKNLENENIEIKFEMRKKLEEIEEMKTQLIKSDEDIKNHIKLSSNLKTSLIETKENFLSEITDLKIKFSQLETEKKSFSLKNEELEKSYKNLKNEFDVLKNKNNELDLSNKNLKNEFDVLKNKNNELDLSNKNLKNEFDVLKNKNTQYELKFENLTKQLNNLTSLFEKNIEENFKKSQKTLKINEILTDIKQRDNYNAFIYMILINSGYTFENIWTDKKNIISKKEIKVGKEFLELFKQLSSKVYYSNEDAHDSLENNIYGILFPNDKENLKKFFNDELVNDTKKIIKGLKNYIINKQQGKTDKLFEKKIIDVTNKIKNNFKATFK